MIIKFNFLIVLLVIFFTFGCGEAQNLKLPPKFDTNEAGKSEEKLGKCTVCKSVIESFKKGMEKTTRSKHDGGDADWEEKKLGSYKTSEVRLVEIQESLCEDVDRGQSQCHSLAADKEHLIEEWWFKQQSEHELFPWLCIDQLKACCPSNHFGPECLKCSDCNGNGRCKGNGTRKGNGKCACDPGYSGEFCKDCSLNYYESYRDDTKLLCSECHLACESSDGCTGSGPKACRKCKIGWEMNSETGCYDINECVIKPNICHRQQFCVNNEGSYSCLDCDRSCEGCIGDGPDMCSQCAPEYELVEGKCSVIEDEDEMEKSPADEIESLDNTLEEEKEISKTEL